jgi:hypothetical protein
MMAFPEIKRKKKEEIDPKWEKLRKKLGKKKSYPPPRKIQTTETKKGG